MATIGKFAKQVQIENHTRGRKFVKIDGEYFPWLTDGISVEITADGRKFLNLRILCDEVIHTVDHAYEPGEHSADAVASRAQELLGRG